MSQITNDTQPAFAHGITLEGGHSPCAIQRTAAPLNILTIDQDSCVTQQVAIDGQPLREGVTESSTPIPQASPPDESEWKLLRIWAEVFDDAQKQRISMENRILRGGADPGGFDVFLSKAEAMEKEAQLGLRTTYRNVVPEPLRQYQVEQKGVGEHLFARFLGHLGHPIHTTLKWWENKELVAGAPMERSLGQLMQYAGHGAPVVRRKGMAQSEAMWNGNPQVKMLLHLIAEGVLKAGGQLRAVYDEARAVEHVHTVECVRCGPSGKPAQIGSPWNKGHSHADGLRKIGKQILRDIYELS